MKKNILIILFAVHAFALHSQNNKNAAPTKYAVVLYIDQAVKKSGDGKLIAAHWQIKGGSSFEWQKDISDEGDYEIMLSYATYATGFSATISTQTGEHITASLSNTTGYYPAMKDWANFNCERVQLPGKLHLRKGGNKLLLELVSAKAENNIILNKMELVPVAKKAAIQKDHDAAIKSHANTDWFANSLYGVMFHWTSQSMPEHGEAKPYSKAVADFDVDAFVNMVIKTGAHYVILTTNHAEPYFPASLKEWEKNYPGHTTRRDLVQEISDGLAKHNIRLFLYLATHVYARSDSVDDQEFTRLNYTLLREIGERYKKSVAGYWFDGWYQCYEKHPQFDFEAFYKICKAGNPGRIVSLNTWLYPVTTMWQDYWAGELYTIGNASADRICKDGPGSGLQAHNLIVLQTEDWLHTTKDKKIPAPHITAQDLAAFISRSKGKCPVTINMQIYQDGRIGEEALSVMEQVKKIIEP
jgi:hypothetical protein